MPLGKMLSKMSSVIKFEFHVAMKGIHDWFWAKSLTEEFSVLKLTDTCVNLQWLFISYRAKSYATRLVPDWGGGLCRGSILPSFVRSLGTYIRKI